MTSPTIPALAWPILLKPRQVATNLERIAESQMVQEVPNVWQIATGVLRMWHRMMFRPQTIGVADDGARARSGRARLMEPRPLRFPFLLWEGSVAPLDLSGLASTPTRLRKHVLGTFHAGERFAYDLQILACYPGELERLHEEVRQVVDGSHPRGEWLRDLCVYDGYHERLLAYLDRVASGEQSLEPADHRNPDASFTAYLTWCASQPATPQGTWQALSNGTIAFAETSVG